MAAEGDMAPEGDIAGDMVSEDEGAWEQPPSTMTADRAKGRRYFFMPGSLPPPR